MIAAKIGEPDNSSFAETKDTAGGTHAVSTQWLAQ